MGSFALTNLPQEYGIPIPGAEGNLFVTDGWIWHNNAWHQVEAWDVTPDGEFKVAYEATLWGVTFDYWVGGTAVQGLYFLISMEGESGYIRFAKVDMDSGPVPRYSISTNLPNDDPEYPKIDLDGNGTLEQVICPAFHSYPVAEDFDIIFSANTFLYPEEFELDNPVRNTSISHAMLCRTTSAVAKLIDPLDLRIDDTYEPSARSVDIDFVNATLNAIRSWHSDNAWTIAGEQIWIRDNLYGFFDEGTMPAGVELEAAYSERGLECLGPSRIHRAWPEVWWDIILDAHDVNPDGDSIPQCPSSQQLADDHPGWVPVHTISAG